VAIVNSVIAAFYYLNVVRYMFFLPPKDETPVYDSPSLRLALVLTLAMTLVIGIYPQPFIRLAQGAAKMLVF
jgi:NADH-quinone oxidoreductase subunit N